MKIDKELNQEYFANEYVKAIINIRFTASWLDYAITTVLRPFNLSTQQFNLLRVLSLMDEPASIRTLTDKMLDRNSNASRLVDKLLEKGLVERRISEDDRRRVEVSITVEGSNLVDEANRLLEYAITEKAKVISEADARLLNELLDNLRQS
jgi:DNA-binding MarR family transcriptional regulator